MSLSDEQVQDFLKQNVKFLEDLQKVKLPITLKKDREELLRISNEWIFPEVQEESEELPQVPEEPEDTYDDEGGGIYGSIGSDDEDDMGPRGEIQGEGAKILNLHASFKGWLKVEGFFHSSRWWGLIYSKGGPTNIVFLTITITDLSIQSHKY